MPDIFDHITPDALATLLGEPRQEVCEAAAGRPAGYRAYWALHALQIAAGILPADAPVGHMPPRPGPKPDFREPWNCLIVATGGWDRLARALGVALPTLKSWRFGIPSGTAAVQSGILRSLGLRPFFQLDWTTTGKGARYRLNFRRPVLTAEEVSHGA